MAMVAALALAACGDDQQASTATAPGSAGSPSAPVESKSSGEARGPVQVSLLPLPAVAPVHECDRLAADIHDPGRVTQGVAFDALWASGGISACQAALAKHPDTVRFEYQLGRALHKSASYDQALIHYSRSAGRGNAAAMHNLGLLQESGLALEQSHDRAANWFRMAAEKGHPGAMFKLGVAHLNGQGVSRDITQAVGWWQKAADQGDTQAMTILGVHYNWGVGVAQDENRAATLMFRALSNGDESAMREITAKGATWGEPFLRELQRLMLVEGVYQGPTDGKFGADTKLAVQELAQK